MVKIERKNSTEKDEADNRLVKLGDMMADGLHLERGGEWIEKEYRIAMKQAGILPSNKWSDPVKINEFMKKRVQEERCTCGGCLVQSRGGSFRAKCLMCGKVWQLGKRKKQGGKKNGKNHSR